MTPLFVLSYCCISISYLVMFESDSTEALKLEIKEETYLHSERIRKEVSQDETETGEIASPCPGGQEYCESADDYPTDKIKILLKKQPKFILDHFNIERDNQHRDFGPYSPAPGPGSGSGSSDEEVDVDVIPTTPMRFVDWPLCSSMNTVIFPKKAKSNDGLFEFVVNDDEHKQGVRVEACIPAGRLNNEGCNIPGSLSLGYSSRCVQKHIQRTLVVLNSNSSEAEGFVTKPFEFPSCCSCLITMNFDAYDFDTTPFDTDWYNTTSDIPDQSNTSTTDASSVDLTSSSANSTN